MVSVDPDEMVMGVPNIAGVQHCDAIRSCEEAVYGSPGSRSAWHELIKLRSVVEWPFNARLMLGLTRLRNRGGSQAHHVI
jgi:hypothetical protein